MNFIELLIYLLVVLVIGAVVWFIVLYILQTVEAKPQVIMIAKVLMLVIALLFLLGIVFGGIPPPRWRLP